MLNIRELIQSATKQRASAIHIQISNSEGCSISFKILNELSVPVSEAFGDGDSLCEYIFEGLTTEKSAPFIRTESQNAILANCSALSDSLTSIAAASVPLPTGGYVVLLKLYYKEALEDNGVPDRLLALQQQNAWALYRNLNIPTIVSTPEQYRGYCILISNDEYDEGIANRIIGERQFKKGKTIVAFAPSLIFGTANLVDCMLLSDGKYQLVFQDIQQCKPFVWENPISNMDAMSETARQFLLKRLSTAKLTWQTGTRFRSRMRELDYSTTEMALISGIPSHMIVKCTKGALPKDVKLKELITFMLATSPDWLRSGVGYHESATESGKEIAKRLVRALRKRGVTMLSLHYSLEITPQHVDRLGRVVFDSDIKTIEKIAAYHFIRIEHLINGDPDESMSKEIKPVDDCAAEKRTLEITQRAIDYAKRLPKISNQTTQDAEQAQQYHSYPEIRELLNIRLRDIADILQASLLDIADVETGSQSRGRIKALRKDYKRVLNEIAESMGIVIPTPLKLEDANDQSE